MPAYSGAELRIRDKAIEEKHQKEIASLEAKANRLRYAYDQRSDEYFNTVNHMNKVADLLGFRTLSEVQTFIEIADEQLSYKDLAERVDGLKVELALQKREKETLMDEMLDIREERDVLKATLAQNQRISEPTAQELAKDLVNLQTRLYDEQEKHRRSTEEFKDRYAKWGKFKRWMLDEEMRHKKKVKQLSDADRMLHEEAVHPSRRQKLEELGLTWDEEPESAMDDHETPLLPRSNITPTFPSSSTSSPTMIGSDRTTPKGTKSTKKYLLSSTRTPLEFESIRVPRSSPADRISPLQSSVPGHDIVELSDTEDESQDPLNVTNVLPMRPIPDELKITRKPSSPHPTLPPRPDFPQFTAREKPKKQRHSDVFPSTTAIHARPDNDEQERPRKMRRYSSPVRAPLADIPSTGPRSLREGASSSTTHGRENRVIPIKRQSTGGGNAPSSTPANTATSKQLTDYSAFKGRGRYGKTSVNETINGTYAIDPAQNGGMDFQYDTVVRGKEDRRKMAGGDCECCRDYYEAIGPLPSRLQPPLWRSPPNSPEKSKPCRHNADTGREEAITSHKQAISRHRHQWARTNTPPSYWSIGFPSTQETENINQRAAEMHQQKRKDIQAEAENGGRYYKTR